MTAVCGQSVQAGASVGKLGSVSVRRDTLGSLVHSSSVPTIAPTMGSVTPNWGLVFAISTSLVSYSACLPYAKCNQLLTIENSHKYVLLRQ